MAKVTLNSAFTQLRGSIGGFVVKHTADGPVLARRPDMTRVKWSPAQRAHRKLMQEAAAHYRTAMKDPKQAAHHTARAAKQKIPVSALVMGEYLKRARQTLKP